MIIGVGVKGPSDREFWDKGLHKYIGNIRFDIRHLKTREKLIKKTPELYNEFKNFRYRAGFIIGDLDQGFCVSNVLNHVPKQMQNEFTSPWPNRFLHLLVSQKDLESWFLADWNSIEKMLPNCPNLQKTETENYGKGFLKQRLKECRNIKYNEFSFVKQFALNFNPNRARQHTKSFDHCWKRIQSTV